MKMCAKCGTEYEDSYDGCPKCANRGLRFFRGYLRFNQIALAIVVVLILVLMLMLSIR